jgi:hypothetical protein
MTESPRQLAVEKRKLVGYGIAFGACACGTGFFFSKIPAGIELMVVPEVFLIVSLTIPLLLWASLSQAKSGRRVATVSCCVLWVAGIIAGFQIPPTSDYIYVGDALLLIGFVPLLHSLRFSWTWIIFGALNFGIGVFLQAIRFMPDNLFPEKLVIAKHHLAQYHPAITWWIVGGLAVAWGIVRLIANQLRKRA